MSQFKRSFIYYLLYISYINFIINQFLICFTFIYAISISFPRYKFIIASSLNLNFNIFSSYL